MCAHVLLNSLNELRKIDSEALARMLDPFYHMTLNAL